MGLVLYGLGTVGFSGANVFYDSMLVDVAEEEELDLVSALGYSAGYIGGGLLFAVNVLMVQKPEWFGLQSAASAVKVSFLSVSVWWAVFTVPLLRSVREAPTEDKASPLAAVRAGLRQLVDTFKEIRSFKVLVLFLRGVLDLHRRREHRHQDGGVLWRPCAWARARCADHCLTRDSISSRSPPRLALAGSASGSDPSRPF